MHRSFVRRMAVAAPVLAVVMLAVFPGIGAHRRAVVSAQATDGSYVGRLESIDAVVGVVAREGGAVAAFVTDGRAIADWFRGAQNGPGDMSVELVARSGGRLQLVSGGGVARGRYTAPDGRVAEFATVPALGNAGTYRSETFSSNGSAKVVSAGWVVMNSGEVRGVLTVRPDVDEPDVNSGLDPSTLDLTTMFANLPDFGVVRVIKVGFQ